MLNTLEYPLSSQRITELVTLQRVPKNWLNNTLFKGTSSFNGWSKIVNMSMQIKGVMVYRGVMEAVDYYIDDTLI